MVTEAKKGKKRNRILSMYERETIITFNEEEPIARVFTYNKRWQKHLENKLELKPTLDNGLGGKGYELDKKRIPMPRVPRKLSDRARRQLSERGRWLGKRPRGSLQHTLL
jgi:hypothetical protein